MQNNTRSFKHLSDSTNERVYQITDKGNVFVVTLLNMGRYFYKPNKNPYDSPKVIWKLAQISTDNHLLEFFYSADGNPVKCLISDKNSTYKRAILWTYESENSSQNKLFGDFFSPSLKKVQTTDAIYDIGDVVFPSNPRAVYYYDSNTLSFTNEDSQYSVQYSGTLAKVNAIYIYNLAKFEYNSSPKFLMLLSQIPHLVI